MKKKKTNVMRILDKAGIAYNDVEYEYDESDLSGMHAATQLGQDPNQVFKTLVLKGARNGYFVCCIPVNKELDLKKAAKIFKDKKAEMIPLKDLNSVTGYLRGGCSPIGMKKHYPVFIDQTACSFDEIGVSAGERGKQIFLSPDNLRMECDGEFADLV